ncbi:hypothetical protein EXIGLDRAFT_646506 [Exidia glandulosa HHB12029]|uniref:Uncharacterized protein n=1 Tax=Exidia glandulosa HHB12029 TaxID=1314781 RepID=A0A165IAS5_EXIGL|nr:hypothetical protein EXIGLDRAFT_646506 [Exidia glandulosa HHB12029]
MDAILQSEGAPDDQDEVVSSSDVDEREELAALRDDYWAVVAHDASKPNIPPMSPTPDPLDVLANYAPYQPLGPARSEVVLGRDAGSPVDLTRTPTRVSTTGELAISSPAPVYAGSPMHFSPLADLFTPLHNSTRTTPLPGSSPLTPAPSPHKAGDFFSDDEPHPPAPPQAPSRSHAASPPPDIPPDTRYSLRHRNLQQMRPYEYDKRVYKHQMRGDPNAIVRLRSPDAEPRRRAQDPNDPEADAWIEPAQEESQDKDYVAPASRPPRDGGDSGENLYRDVEKRVKVLAKQWHIANDEPPKKKRKIAHHRAVPFPLDKPEGAPASTDEDEEQSPRIRRRLFHRTSSSTARVISSPAAINDRFGFLRDEEDDSDQLRREPSVIDLAHDDNDRMDVDDSTSPTLAEGVEEEEEDEDDDDSDFEQRLAQWKYNRKILRRVRPEYEVKRMMPPRPTRTKERQRTPTPTPTPPRPRSPEEPAELQPGRGRVRFRPEKRGEPLDIRGDPDSSSSSSSSSSESESERGEAQGANVRDESTAEPDAAHAIDDDEIEEWYGAPEGYEVRPRKARPGVSDAARGGDLIDRMLSRTRRIGGPSKKRRSPKPPRVHRGPPRDGSPVTRGRNAAPSNRRSSTTTHGPSEDRRAQKRYREEAQSPGRGWSDDEIETHSRPKFNVTTAGAKRFAGRQTTLNFPKLSSGGAAAQATTTAKKSKKPPKGGRAYRQGDFYVFEGHMQASPVRRKRYKRHTIQVNGADDDLVAALTRDAPHKATDAGKPVVRAPRSIANRPPPKALPANPLENYSPERDARFRAEEKRIRRAGDEHAPAHIELTLDFDVPFLSQGIGFAESSYIGKGRLHELVSLATEAPVLQPASLSFFRGVALEPSISADEFEQLLPTVLDKAHDWIVAVAHGDIDEGTADVQVVFSFISRYFSTHTQPDLLHAYLASQVNAFAKRLQDHAGPSKDLAPPVMAALWFNVEIMVRICLLPALRKDPHHVGGSIQQMSGAIALLVRRLLALGFENIMDPLIQGVEKLQATDTAEKAIECWICLVHTVKALSTTPDCTLGSIWEVLVLPLGDAIAEATKTELHASEMTWRVIFSLCAISQFSVYGIATSTLHAPEGWSMVVGALRRIRLTPDEKDSIRPAAIIHMRDRIVRLVTSRCFLLCKTWKWRLNNVDALWKELSTIFSSRHYANLSTEKPEFPVFIVKHDLRLLREYKFKDDNAYAIVLKLIVLASEHAQELDPKSRASKVFKLVALMMPQSRVPFAKDKVPTGAELSKLINRYSAALVALSIDPTPANALARIKQVRGYLVFKDAEYNTRYAAIRAAMYLAIMCRHFHLPLDAIFDWLEEMILVLLTDWNDLEVAARTKAAKGGGSTTTIPDSMVRVQLVLAVQMVLGCVCAVIERSNMDPSAPKIHEYPDPGFLEGAWILRILSSPLKDDPKTCAAVRNCVQTFLKARRMTLTEPARPPLAPLEDGENEESQGGFDDFDFDDPVFLLAMGDVELTPEQQERQIREARVSTLIHDRVEPVIFDLVCNRYGPAAKHTKSNESGDDEAQKHVDLEWVDCWAGCLHVTVKNGKTNWSVYTKGDIWKRIIDSHWRRRVRQRFMYNVLLLHPMAYKDARDSFVDVLVQALVCTRVSWEHLLASELFTIDGLRHPLLRDIHVTRDANDVDVKLSAADLDRARLGILESIITRVVVIVTAAAVPGADAQVKAQGTRFVSSIVDMLGAMRDNHAIHPNDKTYAQFCGNIREFVSAHPSLMRDGRVVEALAV